MSSKIDTILPDSVAIFPNILSFDLAVKDWLDDVRIDQLFIYNIDTVPVSALQSLAEQFDVLGLKGWALASTEVDKRALIKRAIELHRYKGTVWAIKESLKSIGFDNVTIVEHTGGHWARFTVYLLNQNVPITNNSIGQVMSMIEEYKNARSVLEAIIMTLNVTDDIQLEDGLADVLEEIKAEDDIIMNGALFHDGTALHDGIWDRSGEADVALITP